MINLTSAGVGGVGMVFGVGIGIVLMLSSCGTAVKATTPAATSLAGQSAFPTVAGTNLNGRKVEFPGGMDAPYSILLVAFYQRQQTEVNTWLASAKEIIADHANVEYYELPTISGGWTVARGWVDGGMRSGIPAFSDRERTVTIYTDTGKFRRLAGIDNPERIWAALVGRDGTVYWTARGAATDESLAELKRRVREVASSEEEALR